MTYDMSKQSVYTAIDMIKVMIRTTRCAIPLPDSVMKRVIYESIATCNRKSLFLFIKRDNCNKCNNYTYDIIK